LPRQSAHGLKKQKMRIKSKLFQWLLKDKTILEQVEREKWLAENRVPKSLWKVTVSASDDFLVVRCPKDATLYRIYQRKADGEVHTLLNFKEFYARDAFIRSPKDFPPEKIKEKWEEWHYQNEFYAGWK
jgi:hypothetical protein